MKEERIDLSKVKKKCKWTCCCPIVRFYEEGRLEGYWVEHYCLGDWKKCVRYQMEERGEYHEDCMLPDGTIRKELCD